jgi:hypothetical protein
LDGENGQRDLTLSVQQQGLARLAPAIAAPPSPSTKHLVEQDIREEE